MNHKKPLLEILPFLGLAIPVLLLTGSYLYMAVTYGKLWLFNTIVHENGRYTLLQTILYFRHFTWEFLGKSVYCLYLVGAFFYYGSCAGTKDPGRRVISRWRAHAGWIIGLGISALAIFTASRQFGFTEIVHGLLQYRVNEGSLLEFGSHWRNHFLSNIALFAGSVLAIILYRILGNGRGWKRRKYFSLFGLSALAFFVLTIVFGFNAKQFQAPSYLGHQLREILGTDLSITMLLALSLLIWLERRYDTPANPDSECKVQAWRVRLLVLLWTIPVAASCCYLAASVARLNIGAELAKASGGRNGSIPGTFCWHFFEHSLDYVFVLSSVYGLYLGLLRAGSREPPHET
jgi:hypothetical protein